MPPSAAVAPLLLSSPRPSVSTKSGLARDSAMEPPRTPDPDDPGAPAPSRSVHVSAIQLELKGEDRVLLLTDMSWSGGAGAPTRCERGDAGRSRAHAVLPLPPVPPPTLVCVFDGHNGPHAATAAADELGAALAARLPGPPPASELAADAGDAPDAAAAAAACPAAVAWRGALVAALVGAFHDVQVAWAARGAVGGTTATVALVAGRLVTVANVGDSLGVLDTGAAVAAVTGDHRVHNSRREQERVRAAGGVVSRVAESGAGPAPDPASGLGPLRVWPGGVANARALGDFDVSPVLLLPAPHVTQVRLPTDGGRLIIASDGVWDCLDVHRAAKAGRSVAACEAAERLLAATLRATGGIPRDDVSVVVVDVLPRGVPSFPEACGRRLKRSASRGAALAAAGVAPEEALGSRHASPAPRRPAGPSPPRKKGGEGGLFACCASAPATADDETDGTAHGGDAALRAVSESRRPPDRSVRGGGYGPSVRGGRAFWGATVGSRSPSMDAEAGGGPGEGSAHSGVSGSVRPGSGSVGGGGGSTAPPGGVGGSSSAPRLETLASIDVAILLGLVPASAADAAARDAAAASWATPAFLAELAAAAARAHAMFAKRSGCARPSARVVPVADATQHPAARPTAVPVGHGGALRRAGSGPTPVVSVPPLADDAAAALAAAAGPSPPGRAGGGALLAAGGGAGPGGDAVGAGDAEGRVHRGRSTIK